MKHKTQMSRKKKVKEKKEKKTNEESRIKKHYK